MTDDTLAITTESWLQEVSAKITSPSPGECLYCYVARMLGEFGCDNTLRFACSFRNRRAPRAVALERRLGMRGGYCDCEMFLNDRQLAEHLAGRDEHGDPLRPDDDPACAGVRRGSTRGCTNWVKRRRGWGY